MIEKMGSLKDEDQSADKILNRKYYTVSLNKSINTLNELAKLNQELIENKIEQMQYM